MHDPHVFLYRKSGGGAITGSDVSRRAQTGSCITTHRHL